MTANEGDGGVFHLSMPIKKEGEKRGSHPKILME